MAEKPTAAFVLGLIGGIFILLVALFVAAIGGAMAGMVPRAGGLVVALGVFGILCGILVIASSVMLYNKPEDHTMWGVIALLFSILGFAGGGGLFIGSILGIIGGALGIAYRPPAPAMGMPGMAAPTGWPAQPAGQMPPMGPAHCTQCGAPLAPGATSCGSCGAPVS